MPQPEPPSEEQHEYEPSVWARVVRLDERVLGLGKRLDSVESTRAEDRRENKANHDTLLSMIQAMPQTLLSGPAVVKFIAWAISIVGIGGIGTFAWTLANHH